MEKSLPQMKYKDKSLGILRQRLLDLGKLRDIKDMLDRTAKIYGDRDAIVEKKKDVVITHTVRRLTTQINALGTALVSLGLKGKNIGILGESSYGWILSFFAVTCGCGAAVPLDKELGDEALSALMDKGDVEALICSKTYYETAKKHMAKNPKTRLCVTWDKTYSDENIYSIADLLKLGQELIEKGDDSYINAEISPEQLAAIVFTSGTTGANKGVMLTHRNFVTNVEGVVESIDNAESAFSILPMNHVYELGCNIMPAIYLNAVLYINDKLSNFLTNLNRFQPDAMIAVPLVLEQINKSIWKGIEDEGKTELMRKLLRVSNGLLEKGIDLRHLLFAPIAKKFGGKFPIFVCGGAPAKSEYLKSLGDFGFKIYQGYGLTEASPIVTLNTDAWNYPESSGEVFPQTELKIHAPDGDGVGEIRIRGANVTKGYYNDPVATSASFDEDGWFKTGDYGKVEADGRLYVVGRKKNLIILDNGKNVFPEELETAVIENLDCVKEAVAIERTRELLGRKGKIIAVAVSVSREDFPGMSEGEITKLVTQAVYEKVNRKQPGYKKIQLVGVSFNEFEKTTTLKVIRSKVLRDFDNYYQVSL